MLVVGSEVRMGGLHQRREEVVRKEEIRVWKNRSGNAPSSGKDILELSTEARKKVGAGVRKGKKTDQQGWQLSERDKQKILIIEKMLKALTGKDFKIHCSKPRKELPDGMVVPEENGLSSASSGWGFSVELHEMYYESEKMAFSAQGTVRTADGREIKFQVDMKLEREYREETRFVIQGGAAPMTDPLVINFGTGATGISGSTHLFDLNGDGQAHNLPYLARGSGYLALDRDGDGVISNGLELFGPATGNGFDELAAFDEDQNNWIDEGDSIFDQLQIWIKFDDHNEQLISLRQAGIGALYVEGLDLRFSYKDNENQTMAQNRSTGVFLREDGSVGTIQQIDVKA